MADDNATVVRSLFEAFNDGDLDRAAATVSGDFELVDVAASQRFHGPEGCREWLGVFRTALPDACTEIVNLFADGERVASEHIGRGTHTGPFVTRAGTIPPTGRRIEVRHRRDLRGPRRQDREALRLLRQRDDDAPARPAAGEWEPS
jgi:predicted ester cyclase